MESPSKARENPAHFGRFRTDAVADGDTGTIDCLLTSSDGPEHDPLMGLAPTARCVEYTDVRGSRVDEGRIVEIPSLPETLRLPQDIAGIPDLPPNWSPTDATDHS